jgi:hypothetical protein
MTTTPLPPTTTTYTHTLYKQGVTLRNRLPTNFYIHYLLRILTMMTMMDDDDDDDG